MGKEVVRFKKVLRVRATERDITQMELAGRLSEEGAILGRLNEIETNRENALDEFCSGRGETVSLQQLWLERQNIDRMERLLSDGKRELETCRYKIEETKAELLERHQNVQLMERHVGRLEERAAKEGLDLEQKNLDDIASMRYCRVKREA
ncbi:MAG: flagellar FliJ family protein [Synergistaceae bacterium]|jgi:flagellar export protein FliJ|nr:flagellar FliJ family protein [Synergistaceae bacterium]